MPRGLKHDCKVSGNAYVLPVSLIGPCKHTATQEFLLVTIGWYHMVEWKQITEGYSRYMEFDIAFVFSVNVLLDITKLIKTEIICFWFQTMKNDRAWRKVFDRFIIILNVLVNIIGVFFFQVVSIFEKHHSKFEKFFSEELKILRTI